MWCGGVSWTYVVSTAAGGLGQFLTVTELCVKGITFLLGALILPVGRPLMCKRLAKLLDERLVGVQAREDTLGVLAPVDAAVLLAGAADATDARDRDRRAQAAHGVRQARQNKVERLEPHGDWGVDLARLLADVDALFNAIFGPKIAVEINLGLCDRLEV